MKSLFIAVVFLALLSACSGMSGKEINEGNNGSFQHMTSKFRGGEDVNYQTSKGSSSIYDGIYIPSERAPNIIIDGEEENLRVIDLSPRK